MHLNLHKIGHHLDALLVDSTFVLFTRSLKATVVPPMSESLYLNPSFPFFSNIISGNSSFAAKNAPASVFATDGPSKEESGSTSSMYS